MPDAQEKLEKEIYPVRHKLSKPVQVGKKVQEKKGSAGTRETKVKTKSGWPNKKTKKSLVSASEKTCELKAAREGWSLRQKADTRNPKGGKDAKEGGGETMGERGQ